jgi:redox-sensitive bicupin YhaK (pirin superfamily)
VRRIEPGAVNWMSAGRGIVHAERALRDLQSQTCRHRGLQLWIALPEADEESAPSFQHAPAEAIPQVRLDGAPVHVVVGSAFGATSPVETRSPTLALAFDFGLASGRSIELPALATERALHALDHPFEIDGKKTTSSP